MADDGLVLAIAIALDVALTRGAKRDLWIRVINLVSWLLFVALIGGVVYITLKYS